MATYPKGLPGGNLERNYLQEGEERKYSTESVEEANVQQAKIERSMSRLAGGGVIDLEEGQRRAALRTVGYQVNPYSGNAFLPTQDARTSSPATNAEVVRHVALNYPHMAAAAANSNLTVAESIKATNFALAFDAASNIAQSGNPARRAQIINTMGPDMQGLVFSILDDWRKAGERAAQQVEEESSGSLILDLGSKAWGYTLGPALDFAWEANEQTLRAVNTAALTLQQKLSGNNVSYQDVWEATEPGTYSAQGIRQAEQQYGVKTVTVIREALKAAKTGDDDAIGELYEKYYDANDIESMAILDSALFGINTDQNVQDAITYVTSQEIGNLGNSMFWSAASLFGVQPATEAGTQAAQLAAYTATRDVTNVVGTFVFDPLIVGGKVAQAYKGLRYGLRMLHPGKIDTAFKQRSVVNFFDTFGGALKQVDEAKDLGQRAQLLNSIRSQYKTYFDADGIDTLLKAKVRNSDDALDFFRNAENLKIIVDGQAARRGRQIQIPHMTKANVLLKTASLRARQVTYDKTAAQEIDDIFGKGVSSMLPDEAAEVIIKFLSEKDGDKFAGRMLSDFVFANDRAKRTFVGEVLEKALSRMNPTTERAIRLRNAMNRYGYKREGGFRHRSERVARTMAHFPNMQGGLRIADGRDASKVRDLMLYAGMPKYWADVSADMWRNMDEGQRIRFASGIGRSVGYSLGVDIVDPIYGKTLIENLVTGIRNGEVYAPDQKDIVSARAKATAMAENSMLEEMATSPIALSNDVQDALRERYFNRYFTQLMEDATVFNPSKSLDPSMDAANGLYLSQFVDRIAFPDMMVLDRFSMRQSALTAMLGTNTFFTTATDLWTLGTLFGPRFQVRNGIEDALLYGVTGGSWKNFRYGQLYSRAKREATARPVKGLDTAVRGEKLGLAVSTSRWIGDRMPKILNGVILPHLSPKEIEIANVAAANGKREPIVTLINKALMRQKLWFVGIPKNKRVIKDLDEAAERIDFFNFMDEASESSAHLADGIPVGAQAFEEVIINGRVIKVQTVKRQYKTMPVDPGNPDSIRTWWNEISRVLYGDGEKGQKTVSLIKDYYNAKAIDDVARQREIVSELSDWISENADWVLKRSGIATVEGVNSFSRRNLDDVLRIFTTKDGTFNDDLLKKISKSEVGEDGVSKVTYGMWDEVDGKQIMRLTEEDLIKMPGKPQTVLGYEGLKIPVGTGIPFTQRAWSAMGRSLARMTREPIFVANYLDSRDALRPIQQRLAAEFGETHAKNWAVEAAYERAFNLTMAYVDNPMVRSQLAWNVRNVARFYRAQEDFNRRVIRVAKFNPMAIQKINLGWRVLDDTGFVHEDEYGEKYFVWPGSKEGFAALNGVMRALGVDLKIPSVPISFTSRVNMLTPSADPNAWAPTLSGIYASAALKPLMRITPGLSSLEDELFGTYGKDKPVWSSILPPNVLRPLELFMTHYVGEDARQSVNYGTYASSARSAIQALAATGAIDQSRLTEPGYLEDLRRTVDITALDMTLFKTIFSPVAAAAFTMRADTSSDFAKSIGISGMRPAFIEIMKATEGDYDKAFQVWLSSNPGKSIFTVSTYRQNDDIGSFEPFKETVEFIETNKELVDAYPVGSAFFAPQVGTQNLAAWNYLRSMDAKTTKDVERYFNEMVTAEGYAIYRIYKKQYDDAVADGRKNEVQSKWENARADLYARYPMLESRLSGELKVWDTSSRPDFIKDLNEIKGAVEWMKNNRSLDDRGALAEQVLAMYDEAVRMLSEVSKSDPKYDDHRNDVRDMWKKMITDMEGRYTDDRQWESLLYTTTGALGFRM